MPLSGEESPDEGLSKREQPVLPPAVTLGIPVPAAEPSIILPIASPGVTEGSESVKTLPGRLIEDREEPPPTLEASPPTVTPPESLPTRPALSQQSAIHEHPVISGQPASRQPVFRKVETMGESITPAGESQAGRVEDLPVGSMPVTTSPLTKPSEEAFGSETMPIQRAIYPAWKPATSPIQPRPIPDARATPLQRQPTLVSPPPDRQEISLEDITNPAAIWSAPERRELPLSLPGAMVTQREQYPPRPIARESGSVSVIQRSPAGDEVSPTTGAASSPSGGPVTGAASSTAAQPEAQTGKTSPDLEDLAAKVYQIIRRRLRVEIERYRGGM